MITLRDLCLFRPCILYICILHICKGIGVRAGERGGGGCGGVEAAGQGSGIRLGGFFGGICPGEK